MSKALTYTSNEAFAQAVTTASGMPDRFWSTFWLIAIFAVILVGVFWLISAIIYRAEANKLSKLKEKESSAKAEASFPKQQSAQAAPVATQVTEAPKAEVQPSTEAVAEVFDWSVYDTPAYLRRGLPSAF